MILTLKILEEPARSLDASSCKIFQSIGGTIGRRPDNDWVLTDPYVSGRHALIRYINDKFYIEDISTNGVALNLRENRLPHAKPQQLHHGDVLYIDAYEIAVSIQPAALREQDPFKLLWQGASNAAVVASPVGGEHANGANPLHGRSAAASAMVPPVAAGGSGSPGDESAQMPRDVPAAVKKPADEDEKNRSAGDESCATQWFVAPAKQEPDAPGGLAWAEATLSAVDIAKLDPSYATASKPGALRHILQSLLAQFDPDRLQESFDHQILKDSTLGAPAKMRYWDLYRDMYALVAKDTQAMLQQLLAEALPSADEDDPQRRKASGRKWPK